jgi:hypothetical protein
VRRADVALEFADPLLALVVVGNVDGEAPRVAARVRDPLTVSAAPASSISKMPTLTPSVARRSQIARAIPLAPPVTMMFLFSNPRIVGSPLCCLIVVGVGSG